MRGWPTFFASLVFIGLLTASIADLAGGFGCLVGLEDSITAITLVALGTSMPDTLASKTAAIMEKYADNSIINITGSSCINAFLGLGVSWLIASFYWNVVKVNSHLNIIYIACHRCEGASCSSVVEHLLVV